MPPLVFDLDAKILHILESYGAMDRSELHRRTGVPRSTLYDHLAKMWICDIVTREKRKNGGRGRPRSFWKVNYYERQKKNPDSHFRTIR